MGQGKVPAPVRAHRTPDSLSRPPLWETGDDPVGLYLHVPFCRSLCTYCAFAKEIHDPGRVAMWLDGIRREIEVRSGETWRGRPRIDTLFLGGGTPSALSPEAWRTLGDILGEAFVPEPGLEFTSEANPESVDAETLAAMREIGVNRVSLGAQSFNPDELGLLGRPHGAAEVAGALRRIREAGIGNLNLDLMFGLPGQDAASLAGSVDDALGLGPDHLSVYCLGLEPGTPLAADVEARRLPRPGDETARRQYDDLVGRVEGAGLGLYEISNFARPGFACRHNLRYWNRESVVGLGPSAHGLLAGHRWANPAPLERWVAAFSPGERPPAPRPVPRATARFEWVFLRLRLAGGFAESEFEEAWGESFETVHGPVARRLVEAGMISRVEGRVRLTPEARFVSDAVFSEFAPG